MLLLLPAELLRDRLCFDRDLRPLDLERRPERRRDRDLERERDRRRLKKILFIESFKINESIVYIVVKINKKTWKTSAKINKSHRQTNIDTYRVTCYKIIIEKC